ncbi:unnamed protein product, partial [Ixodes pacificus]
MCMFLGCWGIPRPRQCQRRCTATSFFFREQKFVGQWNTIALSGFVRIALSSLLMCFLSDSRKCGVYGLANKDIKQKQPHLHLVNGDKPMLQARAPGFQRPCQARALVQ